jgi:hypothetical protein
VINEPAGAKVERKQRRARQDVAEQEDAYGLGEACRAALRNLVLLRPRTVGPLLIIALLACALDFFAGCQRMLMQKEASHAAFTQGLGQLAIVPSGGGDFRQDEPERLRALAAAIPGVSLVVPHVGENDALRHIAVFVDSPPDEDRVFNALVPRLHSSAPSATVIRANLLSERYRSARLQANLQLGLAGLGLLILAGGISFWAAAVNGKRRQRELVVLRSFGLQRRGITAHVLAEGVLIGMGAVLLGCMISSAASWVMEGFGSHLPVELDPVRLLATMAALLAVSVTAAAVPALKAGHRK